MLARFRPRLNHATLVAYAALFIALGGAALAATGGFVDSKGQIHGCVGTKGQLGLVKPGHACKKGTSAIAWNQRGPRGLTGARGATGAPGPSHGVWADGEGSIPSNGDNGDVGHISLPAGKYLITATVGLQNADTTHTARGDCDLNGGRQFVVPPDVSGALGAAEVTKSYGYEVQASTTLHISCSQDTSGGASTDLAGLSDITATQVTTLDKQVPLACLARGMLLATPQGPLAAEDVRRGAVVWSTDQAGHRIQAIVLEVRRTPVPASHQMMRLRLADGRTVQTDPDQPTPEGTQVSSLRVGQPFEGSRIVSVERTRYGGGFTVELLPSGPTHTYFANGVLLKSGLAARAG